MTTAHALMAFLIASGLLTITPGLDTALVLRAAAVAGGRRSFAAGVGICAGVLTWGFCASVGLGALLSASRIAYNVLRFSGACYLVFLGCKALLRSGRARGENTDLSLPPLSGSADRSIDGSMDGSMDGSAERSVGGSIDESDFKNGENARRWFLRGLLCNLLNPKVGVFYVTFLPLFIPPKANVFEFSMLLAGIHAVEGILWFALLIAAMRPISQWLRKASVAKAFDRVTGAVFVGFGLRLLFEKGAR